MGLYSASVAHTIATRIWDKYRSEIESVWITTGFPPWWLAGLTGMENPLCREYPDPLSFRFESGVFSKLKALRNPLVFWRKEWNGITQARVRGFDDDVLRNLSTSWGQTQIMGYYVLTTLSKYRETSVAQLRNPRLHYDYTAVMFGSDPRIMAHFHKSQFLPSSSTIAQAEFKRVAHIWNSGQEWNGKAGWAKGGKGNIKTYVPEYMDNCLAVGLAYDEIRSSVTKPVEEKQ